MKEKIEIFQMQDPEEDEEDKFFSFIFTPTNEEINFNYKFAKDGIACDIDIIVEVMGSNVFFNQKFVTKGD